MQISATLFTFKTIVFIKIYIVNELSCFINNIAKRDIYFVSFCKSNQFKLTHSNQVFSLWL